MKTNNNNNNNWKLVKTREDAIEGFTFSTTLLLGYSPSCVPFWDIFSILVALSLVAALQLSNITPGGSEVKVEGRNTRWNRDNKNTLKTILSAVFSLDHKDFCISKNT